MQMDPKMWEQGRREGVSVVPSGRGTLKEEWQIVQSEGHFGLGFAVACGRAREGSCGSGQSIDGFSGEGEGSGSGFDVDSWVEMAMAMVYMYAYMRISTFKRIPENVRNYEIFSFQLTCRVNKATVSSKYYKRDPQENKQASDDSLLVIDKAI